MTEELLMVAIEKGGMWGLGLVIAYRGMGLIEGVVILTLIGYGCKKGWTALLKGIEKMINC